MANETATRNGQGSQQASESGRLNNLQRIAQRKQQVRSLPSSKKLEKLAVYSSCKVYNKFIVVITSAVENAVVPTLKLPFIC